MIVSMYAMQVYSLAANLDGNTSLKSGYKNFGATLVDFDYFKWDK